MEKKRRLKMIHTTEPKRIRRTVKVVTDKTIMWFGEYKGCSMGTVPNWYLRNIDGNCEAVLQKYIDDNRVAIYG